MAMLEVVGDNGVVWPLGPPGSLLGRAPECAVVVPDPTASWHHARVVSFDGQPGIEDLGSTNGTWVNDHRLPPGQPYPLRAGDRLRLSRWESLCRAGGVALAPPCLATPLLIGRDPAADIVLDDPQVSWHHARLTWRSGAFLLEDLRSANGTFVNGRRVRSATVGQADTVLVARRPLALPQAAVASSTLLEADGLWRLVPEAGGWRPILRDVSLSLAAGRLVSIAGPSGAGKSTLVNSLIGYAPAQRGRILFRGMDVTHEPGILHAAMGYVPQENAVHGELAVRQVLEHAALLRLPADYSGTARADRCRLVADRVMLGHRLDARVKQLSGGERKRANIAVELLTEPDVLVLDEPTSGLDPGLERRLIRLLRELATQDRLVLVVTHSPEIINSSDGLILMARGGQLAFQGPPAEALRVAGVADVAGLFAQTSAMPCVQPSSRAVQPGPTPQPTPASVAPIKSAARELGILARRYVACLMADKRNLAVLLLQAPLLGVLMALLFRGPVFDLGQAVSGDGTAPVDDALKLLLGLVVAALWMGLVNSAREVVKERPILRRERLGVVRFSTYLASKSLVLALLALVQVGVLTPIVASQAAVPPDHWPALLLILYLVTVGATGIGLLLSAVSRGVDQAMSAAVVVMVQQLLFAGGLRPIEEMSTALRLVADLTLARWALGGSCAAVGVVELYENLHREKVLTDVMRTDYSTALGVLAALALLPLVAAWPAGQAVLRHSDRE